MPSDPLKIYFAFGYYSTPTGVECRLVAELFLVDNLNTSERYLTNIRDLMLSGI